MARLFFGLIDKKALKLNKKIEFMSKLKKICSKVVVPQNEKSKENKYPNKIWTMWLQGYDKAPDIVKLCIDSIIKYSGNREVIILDKNNLSEYVSLPQFIVDKYNAGIISNALYSDIIRTYLLYYYGGTWIDSTIYCTDSLDGLLSNELLFFQSLRGRNGDVQLTSISSWFIHSKNPSNYLLKKMLYCFYNFFEQNHKSKYYFLYYIIHQVLIDTDEECKKIWQDIPFYLNANVQLLLNEFVLEKEPRVDYIKNLSPIHKLTYKDIYMSKPLNQQYLYNVILQDFNNNIVENKNEN